MTDKNKQSNKIYELMTNTVRELNNNIDNNLNAYLGEVANSRSIRTNILDNIRKDAENINDFIANFNLDIKPHYIAEELLKNPNQNILDLMEKRSGNILDDNKWFNLPSDNYIDAETRNIDDVQEDQEENSDTDEEQQKNSTMPKTPDILDEVETAPNNDDNNSEDNNQSETADETSTKLNNRKRRYSLIIDNRVDDEKDAKYRLKTILYVTPKGEILSDDNSDLYIRTI